MNKIRDSRFELLRIVSIVCIIIYHFGLHTAGEHFDGLSFNHVMYDLYHIGGKFGVNLFVLITGYFSVNSRFKLRKIADLELQMLFYTILFLIAYLICTANGIFELNIKMVIRSILPTSFNAYWFVTTYIGLYLFSPFLNLMISNLNIKQYSFLLIASCMMFSVIPTFLVQRHWVNYLLFFIFLYLIGAFIKLYSGTIEKKISSVCLKLTAIGTLLFMWLSSVALVILEKKIPALKGHTTYFHFEYSTPMLMLSVTVFLLTARMKPFENKRINNIAKMVFGVYLIQSNPIVATYFLWPWLESLEFYANTLWWCIALGITILLLFICICIEKIRMSIFHFIHFNKIDRICEYIENKFDL